MQNDRHQAHGDQYAAEEVQGLEIAADAHARRGCRVRSAHRQAALGKSATVRLSTSTRDKQQVKQPGGEDQGFSSMFWSIFISKGAHPFGRPLLRLGEVPTLLRHQEPGPRRGYHGKAEQTSRRDGNSGLKSGQPGRHRTVKANHAEKSANGTIGKASAHDLLRPKNRVMNITRTRGSACRRWHGQRRRARRSRLKAVQSLPLRLQCRGHRLALKSRPALNDQWPCRQRRKDRRRHG